MSILSRVSEALNPRHLAVQWTREGRVSGLLRAILHELPTDSDGTVALEVDGQAMFEAPLRADAIPDATGLGQLRRHAGSAVMGQLAPSLPAPGPAQRRAGAGQAVPFNRRHR